MSCTTKADGSQLLCGTVRNRAVHQQTPFPPNSMLVGLGIVRSLAERLLDPPPFRKEEKLHHSELLGRGARSRFNIEIGGRGVDVAI